MRALALLASLLLLSGCMLGGGSTAPDFMVRIDVLATDDNPRGYGHGILLDPHTVVTVEHVVSGPGRYVVSRASLHGGSRKRIRYVPAKWIRIYNKQRSVEPLSVLKLKHGIYCSSYPKFRNIEPGDSGSPIMGKRGEVVGLVTGYMGPFPFLGKWRPGQTIIGTNGPHGPTPRDKKKRTKRRKKDK